MSNLDDFFSKRDKKKKTTTKKFTALDANEFAKQLEATSSRLDGEDGEYQNDSDRANNLNSNDNMDEEWRPFESDENKDYTGLKIVQNWKADDRDSNYYGGMDDGDKKPEFKWGSSKPTDDGAKLTNEGGDEETSTTTNTTNNKDAAPADDEAKSTAAQESEKEANDNAGGGEKEKEDKTTTTTTTTTAGAYVAPGLRRLQQQQQQPESEANKTTTTATATTESSSSSSSKYVPPHMRKAGGDSSSSQSSAIPVTSVNYRKPSKAQPNINDTLEFPTLDDNKSSDAKSDAAGNEKFEIPKKGGRVEPKSNESSINLDNKFNALSTKN